MRLWCQSGITFDLGQVKVFVALALYEALRVVPLVADQTVWLVPNPVWATEAVAARAKT